MLPRRPRRERRWGLSFVPLLLAFSTIATAEADELEADDAILDALPEYETVVTADRSEERAFESSRAISVVDPDTIARGLPASVPEAVQDAPGVHLQQTNRGAGSPVLRGRVGPDNLIIVDGVRFNTSTFRTGPNQYLSTIELSAVDRIEVVRGPSSVLYGNGALGGVLHVMTREPTVAHGPTAWQSGARLWLSSHDRSLGGSALVSGSRGPVAGLVSGSLGSFGELRSGGGFSQPHSNYDQGGWLAKLIFEPSTDVSVTGAHLGSVMRGAGRTDTIGRGDVRFYDNTDYLSYLSSRWRGHGVLREVRGVISHHRLVEKEQRYLCSSDVTVSSCLTIDDSILREKRRNLDVIDVLGADVSLRASLLDRRLEILGGADVYYDLVDSSSERALATGGFAFEPRSRGNFSAGSSYLTSGGFIHGRAVLLDRGLGEPKLRMSGGARLSGFAGHAPEVPELGSVEYRHWGMVGSAGVQYYKPGSFNSYASFIQGFRAPNLQETTVLGNTGSKFEVPNGSLRPERTDTVELGAKLEVGVARLGAAVYRSYLVDAIDEEPALWNGESSIDGTPVVRRVNAAAGRYDGVEVSAGVRFWNVDLWADATWTNGELTSASGETHPARRVPPLFGTTGARYMDPRDRFFFELSLRFAGRQTSLHPSDLRDPRICGVGQFREELDPDCSGSPGFLSVDARAGYELTDWSTLTLVAGNLTDASYRTHGSGFDAPGLGVKAMLEARY